MTTVRVPASATTLTTAADALHGEEFDRTRTFVRVGWYVAIAVALAVVVLPGDPQLRTALLAMLGIGLVASIWVYRQLGDRAAYDPSMTHVIALVAVVCGQLGILYVGVSSAAPLIVALGLTIFCRTESLPSAIAVYALAAGAHAIEAALVFGGVIADPGFYPVTRVSTLALVVGHLMVQLMYGVCFFLARLTRKTSLRSIEQLQKATRLAAQRDVQLAELRQDLDRALKVGGPGRFTSHVVGSWTLGNVLGRGAMGEVYEATHVTSGAEGAVKLLRRELLSDASHVERFFREVRVASSLESPHVVRVLEASTPEDPIPFLAMERLRGSTLGELVRKGPVTGVRLRSLVEQIGGVLERATGAGIIHRDLKPHNIFITDDGTWKLLDFGVASLGDSGGTLTQGAVIGTPTYMAPEQARGEPVDHRADLYALGAVIYRCLTGRVPFVARDTPALLYAVVHSLPMRPSACAAVTPHEEAFLAIAIAKAKADRWQTAAELVEAFGEASRGGLPEPTLRRARMLLRAHPWAEPAPVSPIAS